MVTRNPRLFDAAKPLVIARFTTLHDHDMQPGDSVNIITDLAEGEVPKNKGDVTPEIGLRLWLAGWANYAEDFRPTPVETPEEEAQRVVTLEDLGGGWHLIRAPWLGEGEKVQGQEAAEARRDEIIAKGDTKGVTIEAQPGGYYLVAAPWLDDAERIRGKAAAHDRYDALIASGPPEGWVLLTQEEKDALAAEEEAKAAARQAAEDAAEAGRIADKKAIDEAAARDAAAAAEAEKKANGEATPVETPEAGRAFTATEGEDGKFTVTGPDLAEPVVLDTKEEADAKVAELAEAYTEAHPATELLPVTE